MKGSWSELLAPPSEPGLAATPLSVLGSDEGPDAKKRCAKSR